MSESVEPPTEGERVLAASRRPDGTLRKPVRIRAGYTPQDEVAIYQSKGALFKVGQPLVPPGYDPEDATTKPKTKAAKKNEKRKEKKQQASSSATNVSSDLRPSTNNGDDVSIVIKGMDSLTVSQPAASVPVEDKNSSTADLEKRIRALRKKIRISEAIQSTESLTPEQVEKLAKLDTWRKELRDLESKVSTSAQQEN